MKLSTRLSSIYKKKHIPNKFSISKHTAVRDATNMPIEAKCDSVCNFEKDCSENNENVPQRLKQAVTAIVKKEGYINHNIDIKRLPGDGGNHMAVLFEVHVAGTTKDGRKEIDIFVKHIVPNDKLTMFSLTEAYRKEVYAYTELLKIYDKLQKEAGVPSSERLRIVKCYDESDEEFIIMDNISKKGFTTMDRLAIAPFDIAKLSIEQIAKFHALSFVLEKKDPEYFNRKLKCQKHCTVFNEDWKKFVKNFGAISMEQLDDELKTKMKEIITMVIEKFPGYHLNTDTVCCLCHGDFRTNNIMIKTNDKGTKELIVLDYQIINYGSPINDLLFFVATGTDQQFRREHLEDIKDIYYDALGSFLNYFNMDVNDIFSRKTFDELFKERLDYGLLTAVWFLPLVLADSDDTPDISKDVAHDVKFKTHKSIKDRMGGLIEDYVKWGYV